MRKPSTTTPSESESPVIVDLRSALTKSRIQAMTRVLARVLVSCALVEHNLEPANDNRPNADHPPK